MSGIRSNNVRDNGAPVGIQAIHEAGLQLAHRTTLPKAGSCYHGIKCKPNNVALYQIKSDQFTGLNNSICAPKTIYNRKMSGIRSYNVRENGAPVGIQAIFEAGHCRGFSDVWR